LSVIFELLIYTGKLTRFRESDLNLPLGAVAMVLVLVYLNFRVPRTSWREKLSQMDWMSVPSLIILIEMNLTSRL
jgi:hypothetical protein